MTMRKAIFITGGASGIGRAVAIHFGAKGWFVGLADIDRKGKGSGTIQIVRNGQRAGGVMDGGADALVGAATAHVASHRGIDVGVGRLGLFAKQCGGCHDLPGLAIAALRDIELDPGFLKGMQGVSGETLNGGDRLLSDG